MPYTGQTWTDGVTPLDSVHMSALDAGVVGAVDVDNLAAAASQIVANKLLAGDAQPAFKILGDGAHSWGPGSSTAPDTNLYRAAANTLKTDGAFTSALDVISQINATGMTRLGGAGPGGEAGIKLGNAGDTNLYRSGAQILKTDGNFRVGQYLDVDFAGAGYQIRFGSAVDTNLYRNAAGSLKTDGWITIGTNGPNEGIRFVNADTAWGGIWRDPSTGELNIKSQGNIVLDTQSGRLYLSPNKDTNLYRYGANQLMTDGYLYTGQAAYFMRGSATQVGIVAQGGSQAALTFAGDTNLYRSAANELKTDGAFKAGGEIWARPGAAAQVVIGSNVGGNAGIYFGSGFDTNLYRYAGAVLKTDGQFYVTSYVAAAQGTAGQATTGGVGPSGAAGIQLGGAGDVTLYRNSATELKSNVTITAPNVNVQGTNGVMLFGEAGVPKAGSAGSFKITVDGATYYVPFYP